MHQMKIALELHQDVADQLIARHAHYVIPSIAAGEIGSRLIVKLRLSGPQVREIGNALLCGRDTVDKVTDIFRG